jgi:hypothetical protein
MASSNLIETHAEQILQFDTRAEAEHMKKKQLRIKEDRRYSVRLRASQHRKLQALRGATQIPIEHLVSQALDILFDLPQYRKYRKFLREIFRESYAHEHA